MLLATLIHHKHSDIYLSIHMLAMSFLDWPPYKAFCNKKLIQEMTTVASDLLALKLFDALTFLDQLIRNNIP